MRTIFPAAILIVLGGELLGSASAHAQTSVLNVSGALTSSSQLGPTRGPNFYQQSYPITLTAGNQYTIDLIGTANANVDSYLFLLDSSGAIIAQNDDVIEYYVLRSRISY